LDGMDGSTNATMIEVMQRNLLKGLTTANTVIKQLQTIKSAAQVVEQKELRLKQKFNASMGNGLGVNTGIAAGPLGTFFSANSNWGRSVNTGITGTGRNGVMGGINGSAFGQLNGVFGSNAPNMSALQGMNGFSGLNQGGGAAAGFNGATIGGNMGFGQLNGSMGSGSNMFSSLQDGNGFSRLGQGGANIPLFTSNAQGSFSNGNINQ